VNRRHDLELHVVPPGHGASFAATREGGLVLLRSCSSESFAWLKAHVGSEASWHDDQLVIEPRYFPDLADAIIEAGFLFEGGDDLPGTAH
jgi:hypothetical protein